MRGGTRRSSLKSDTQRSKESSARLQRRQQQRYAHADVRVAYVRGIRDQHQARAAHIKMFASKSVTATAPLARGRPRRVHGSATVRHTRGDVYSNRGDRRLRRRRADLRGSPKGLKQFCCVSSSVFKSREGTCDKCDIALGEKHLPATHLKRKCISDRAAIARPSATRLGVQDNPAYHLTRFRLLQHLKSTRRSDRAHHDLVWRVTPATARTATYAARHTCNRVHRVTPATACTASHLQPRAPRHTCNRVHRVTPATACTASHLRPRAPRHTCDRVHRVTPATACTASHLRPRAPRHTCDRVHRVTPATACTASHLRPRAARHNCDRTHRDLVRRVTPVTGTHTASRRSQRTRMTEDSQDLSEEEMIRLRSPWALKSCAHPHSQRTHPCPQRAQPRLPALSAALVSQSLVPFLRLRFGLTFGLALDSRA
ncbi:hypothetical protein EDB84DRAFT_1572489 [Lactarius hengduanensis]|nr:hypothetical protein EDB84DRAFT_1572489 [Lactarius hengduanensis]